MSHRIITMSFIMHISKLLNIHLGSNYNNSQNKFKRLSNKTHFLMVLVNINKEEMETKVNRTSLPQLLTIKVLHLLYKNLHLMYLVLKLTLTKSLHLPKSFYHPNHSKSMDSKVLLWLTLEGFKSLVRIKNLLDQANKLKDLLQQIEFLDFNKKITKKKIITRNLINNQLFTKIKDSRTR